MQAGLLAMVAALAGCSAPWDGGTARVDKAEDCTVSGTLPAGLTAAALCAALRDGFVAGGGEGAARFAIEILSPHAATVSLLRAGEPVQLRLDSMDRTLGDSAFRNHGTALARLLARPG